MKNLITSVLAAGLILVSSCEKGEQKVSGNSGNIPVTQMKPGYSFKEVAAVVEDLNSSKAAPGWIERVKKWIRNHSGTHLFPNCNAGGDCGPCPGFCPGGAFGGTGISGDQVSDAEYAAGFRAYGVSLIENTATNQEAIMLIFKNDVGAFTNSGYVYFESDRFADNTILKALDKSSIRFLRGKYSVSYDNDTGNYYALVKTVIIN